eukprot:3919472-Prymnesium_polylepis.1
MDASEKVAIGSSNLVEIWLYHFEDAARQRNTMQSMMPEASYARLSRRTIPEARLVTAHAVHSIALNADSDTLVVGTSQNVEVYAIVRTLHYVSGLQRNTTPTSESAQHRVQLNPFFSCDPRMELHEYTSQQGEVAISKMGKLASECCRGSVLSVLCAESYPSLSR